MVITWACGGRQMNLGCVAVRVGIERSATPPQYCEREKHACKNEKLNAEDAEGTEGSRLGTRGAYERELVERFCR
jgi:hypothetical protein